VVGKGDAADQFAAEVVAANGDGIGVRSRDCRTALVLRADLDVAAPSADDPVFV
jgi:hypothetical protein